MANSESRAEKSVGGLYIDLGLKGLGNMIKGLNGVSANFLLAKNAIQQAVTPLANMSRQAGMSVVAFDKINAVTGISVDRLQELKQYTKLNNLDFGTYVNQLQKMQQAFIGIKMGDSTMLKGLTTLGIDPRQFDYKNPEKALNIILKKVNQLDEATGTYALSLLGLDSSFMYMMKDANQQVDDIYKLSGKQLENLREQNEQWNELDVGVESLSQKFIASAPMQKGLKFLVETTKGWINIIDDNNGEWTNFKNNIQNTVGPLIDILNLMKGIKEYIPIKDFTGKEAGEHLYDKGITNPNFYDVSQSPFSDNNLPKLLTHPYIVNDIIKNSKGQDYQVTVNQYINGENPLEIGQESRYGLNKALNDVRNRNGSNQ